MIIKRSPDELTTWYLVFDPECVSWWGKIIPGHFKHVSAFTFSHRMRAWVFYDVNLANTRLIIMPEGDEALDRLAVWTGRCSILKCKARHGSFARPPRLFFSCVTAMLHLLGLKGGAVRPDRLWSLLLASGAEIVWNEPRQKQCGKGGGAAIAGLAAAGVAATAAAGSRRRRSRKDGIA